MEPPNIHGRKVILDKHVFLTKSAYSLSILKCNRELIPECWSSYGENTLVYIELSFRNLSVVWKRII